MCANVMLCDLDQRVVHVVRCSFNIAGTYFRVSIIIMTREWSVQSKRTFRAEVR
jgi:hypothetical protein